MENICLARFVLLNNFLMRKPGWPCIPKVSIGKPTYFVSRVNFPNERRRRKDGRGEATKIFYG